MAAAVHPVGLNATCTGRTQSERRGRRAGHLQPAPQRRGFSLLELCTGSQLLHGSVLASPGHAVPKWHSIVAGSNGRKTRTTVVKRPR